jgi:hypothetical protein
MEDLRTQRIIAKAHLDLLIEKKSHGTATADQVDAQRIIFEKLKVATSQAPPINLGVTKVHVIEEKDISNHAFPIKVDYDLISSQSEELNSLLSELQEIDLEKNKMCNALAKIPPTINAKKEVQAIKAKREEWLKKSDEIWYYKKHGQLMEQEAKEVPDDGAYLASLPRDRYELEKVRRNVMSNISKCKSKLSAAKEEATKRHHETEQMKWQIKMNIIENLIGSI